MTEQMKILYGHLGCISRDLKVKNLDNLTSVLNVSSRKRSLGAPDESIGVAQLSEYHPARIAFLTLAHAKSCLDQVFLSLSPCPSLPSVSTDDRKKLQS